MLKVRSHARWLARGSALAVALLAALSVDLVASRAGAQEPPVTPGAPAPATPATPGAPAPEPPVTPPAPVAPSAAMAVVPPRLLSSTNVTYPPSGEGFATVVLVVTVSADGTVRGVTSETGDEPFASAAREAAASWRFEPALRNGAPIAAVVRAEVTFRPPSTASQQGDQHLPVPVPVPVPAPAPVEVTIRGVRPLAPAVTSFDRSEVRQLPGAFGDPFRAIEALPGVTPIASGLPFFYVRGAPPGNVGYFLDGVRVPLLYHLGAGPSVIHPAIVDRVDLYPGGYPAEFGRFAGGIVAAETTPAAPVAHGEANVRLLDAGAFVEAPVSDRLTVAVGGRYSYTALLLSLLAPDTSLSYWDYQARLSYRLTPKDTLTMFVFGSFDGLGQKDRGVSKTLISTQFHRADMRFDRDLGDGGTLRLATTLGFDRTYLGDSAFVQDLMAGARLETTYRLSPKVTLRAGLDVVVDQYDLQPVRNQEDGTASNDDVTSIVPKRIDVVTGGRIDIVAKVAPNIEIIPGLRIDNYISGAKWVPALDPRIAARISLTDHLRVTHTLGIAHQPPAFIVPIPGFRVSGLDDGLQESVQWSAGIEHDFADAMSASVTAFQNIFLDMTDPLGTLSIFGSGGPTQQLTGRTFGSTAGLELMIRRRLSRRVGGFVSYTLSRSQRTVAERQFPAAFDRTHVLNAALSFDLGRHWRAGARGSFYTGTPEATSLRVASPFRTEDDTYTLQIASQGRRMPAFYRLDLRLEKRWQLGETAWISFVAEMMNATLNKETFGYDCSATGCKSQEIGPVAFPSLGVEAAF